MYLHLGKNVVVTQKSILGIFDLDNCSQSYLTREYLARAEKAGQVINVSDDLPKSFVVCMGEDGSQYVYLSQLASATLLKRSEGLGFE
ncbi:MAG TPA: DUF370 domain-containing protein [Clostridiales bacterium]|jgi:hypothetical protein|nr:DUF370 domain-containing protein [Clostridiales bacterium]